MSLDQLHQAYEQRDLVLFALFVILVAIGWHVANRLAQVERIARRHCGEAWALWVDEDRVEQEATSYRRIGHCPRGHGFMPDGECKTCGFR